MRWQRCTSLLSPFPKIFPPLKMTGTGGGEGVWGMFPAAMADTAQPRQQGQREGDQPPRPRAQPRPAADDRGTAPIATHPHRDPGPAHPGTAGRGARAGRAAQSPGARQRQRGTPSPPPPPSLPLVPTAAAPGRAQASGGSSSSGQGRGRR